MTRELVSKAALSAEMTERLQKKVGKPDCSLSAPHPFSHPDADGSNWDGGAVIWTGCTLDELPIIQEIISDCRSRYNIL